MTGDDGPTVVLDARDATRVVASPGLEGGDGDGDGSTSSPRGRAWRRYGVLVATGLLIFLVALLAITGIERVKGSPLSGGEGGTSVGTVLGDEAAATTTTSAPESDESAPTTTAPETTEDATTTSEAPEPTTTTSEAPDPVPSGLLPGN